MALDLARKYLDATLQKEMCKRFSSRFDNVNQTELSPFIAVLRMIKIEYALTKPEIFKTLVAVLHDFNPSAGSQHREKTCKYIRTLLMGHPEMADYLISVLPPGTDIESPSHVLHTAPTSTYNGDTTNSTQQPSSQLDCGAPKKDPVKYFNFTPPAVSAFVASQGIPQRIFSGSLITTAGTATKTTQSTSAVHRYVIVNEPGGNLKRAEDDHRPTTTIIQIPQGAASTLSSSKILECINAAKKDANSAVTMVTEGKDDAKTTVKVSKARRINKLVCDTDESHVIKHFIQDKSGKLKLHSKGRIPAKLQKPEDKILENKAKSSGLNIKKERPARKKPKISISDDDSSDLKQPVKPTEEKSDLSQTYQTSNSKRTFPYMQTVIMANNAEQATKVVTKFESDNTKIPPLVHLQKMVDNPMWQKTGPPVVLQDPAALSQGDFSVYANPPMVSYRSMSGPTVTQAKCLSSTAGIPTRESTCDVENLNVLKFQTGDAVLLSSSCMHPEKPAMATNTPFYVAPDTPDNVSITPSNANTTTESEMLLDCESVSMSSSMESDEGSPNKLKTQLKVVLDHI